MGDMLRFEGMTKVEIPPEELLDAAKSWEMTKCMVLGIDVDGELCFGGSFSDVPLMNLLLDHAKRYVIETEDGGERLAG